MGKRKWATARKKEGISLLSDLELDLLVEACRSAPMTENRYLATDFVSALLDTVLDYQMHTTTVRRSISHFNEKRWDEVRTMEDLEALLRRFPDDKEGNTSLAVYL